MNVAIGVGGAGYLGTLDCFMVDNDLKGTQLPDTVGQARHHSFFSGPGVQASCGANPGCPEPPRAFHLACPSVVNLTDDKGVGKMVAWISPLRIHIIPTHP